MTGLRPWAKKVSNRQEALWDEEVKQERWPCPVPLAPGRSGQSTSGLRRFPNNLIASPVVPGSCSLYGKE